MDELLREGVLRYGNEWEDVSTHMTPHECPKEEVEKRYTYTTPTLFSSVFSAVDFVKEEVEKTYTYTACFSFLLFPSLVSREKRKHILPYGLTTGVCRVGKSWCASVGVGLVRRVRELESSIRSGECPLAVRSRLSGRSISMPVVDVGFCDAWGREIRWRKHTATIINSRCFALGLGGILNNAMVFSCPANR